MRSFCRKTQFSIKFRILDGGFEGGGGADFIFMGAGILHWFSLACVCQRLSVFACICSHLLTPPLSRPPLRDSGYYCNVREQESMLLVDHAFARVTQAIFVIFVVFTGSEQQSPCLLGRTQVCHFRRFRQNPFFWQGTKARFTKSTVSATPTVSAENVA